jgi:hypothetical protein
MHSGAALCTGVDSDGPRDSGLVISLARSSRLSTALVRGAPHISQVDSEGWFSRVHRGQDTMPFASGAGMEPPDLLSLGGGPGTGLFDMPAIAAFTTCTIGGLMPHARHGGMGVRDAIAGSKFEGTGFEKEHIGQTHVALCCGAGAGLLYRGGVAVVGLPGVAGTGAPRVSCFRGFGKKVIFAEDLRKPAYLSQPVLLHASSQANAYVELRLLYILQEDGHRVLPWFSVVDIARAVRGQVGLAMLILWYLELAEHSLAVHTNRQHATWSYPS